MTSVSNVIAFKPCGTANIRFKTDKDPVRLTRSEEESLISSARKTLTDIETLWEKDHNSIELRDKIHLLHYYLGYLEQHIENNT